MNKVSFKKPLVFLAASAMLLGSAAPVYAQEPAETFEAVSENDNVVYFYGTDALAGNAARYALIYKIGIGLTIEDHIAYMYTECKTYENADISMTAELQRLDRNWKTIKTYTNSEDSAKLCSIDKSYAVTSGYDYRLKVTVSVTDGTQTKTDTQYGTVQTCYSLSETE